MIRLDALSGALGRCYLFVVGDGFEFFLLINSLMLGMLLALALNVTFAVQKELRAPKPQKLRMPRKAVLRFQAVVLAAVIALMSGEVLVMIALGGNDSKWAFWSYLVGTGLGLALGHLSFLAGRSGFLTVRPGLFDLFDSSPVLAREQTGQERL